MKGRMRGRPTWVRALSGLGALFVMSGPLALAVAGALDLADVERSVQQALYGWFAMELVVLFFGGLAFMALWLLIRLAEAALDLPPPARLEERAPADWPLSDAAPRARAPATR
jgi:hypothetical protein